MLQAAVIGAGMFLTWVSLLVLHRQRTDRRVHMLEELVGRRVTLGVGIRGSLRFSVPLVANITDVDTTRDHEWVYLDVIGLHPAVESKAFAQSAVGHFQEMEEDGIPLGFVRYIEVDESRLRW